MANTRSNGTAGGKSLENSLQESLENSLQEKESFGEYSTRKLEKFGSREFVEYESSAKTADF